MRGKKLAKNTISSLLFQVTTIVCGFILPRFILQKYGSAVNGLVNSITQFLMMISFLEFGIGAVVQSSLYKPLAEEDRKTTSQIMVSASRFFGKIAAILTVYVIVLIVAYPFLVAKDFSRVYTATLILAISISFFAQYYFGVVDRLLLTADQKGYIQFNAQTITLIVNTVVCVILILMDVPIQVLKLTTSLIYLARPIYLRLYVNKHYQINRKETYDTEPIRQKWNGLAQHVAAVVLDWTDNIVLTLFDTLVSVSIYSVYFLVVNSVKQLFLSMSGGVQALLGELWAKEEKDALGRLFSQTEWIINTGVTFVFGSMYLLIVPFIRIYTRGVADANYIQPLFAGLLVLANAMHCLRLPYSIMILAVGHYKETQHSYIIAVMINIILSILMVHQFGLIGVAIGTLAAMLYQTVWMARYVSKNLIQRSLGKVLRQWTCNAVVVILMLLYGRFFTLKRETYPAWILLAIEVAASVLLTEIAVNLLFYREKCVEIIRLLRKQKR